MIRCNVIKVLMRNIEPWEGILGVDLGILGVGSGNVSWEWILGVDLGSG
jgi:hypothetical protein